MPSQRPSRKDIESLCTNVGPEDGIDPRLARTSTGRDFGRKQMQLCRQVQRTLSEALAACGDGLLLELEVAGVAPAPGAGRMLVTLRPSLAAPPRDLAEYEGRLAQALGFLRNEVAAAVHRRKAPELVTRVTGRPEP
jgi:ribosome-binding factor A